MIGSALLMALRAIRRNALRSALTTLGIVIGVGAVIAMVSLGEGATARVTGEIASLGHNMLVVAPGSERRMGMAVTARSFEEPDVAAVAAVPGVLAAAPTASRGVRAVFGNKNRTTNATGTSVEFFDIRGWGVHLGRLFTPAEQRAASPVCVIGETIRTELFGSQDPLGATLRIDKLPCPVVGVLEARGRNAFGMDQDDLVLLPLRAFQRRLAGSDDIGAILVSTASAEQTSVVQRQLESVLRARRNIREGQDDDFVVRDLRQVTEMISTVTGVLTALLGAIAAVSLLVGGIGIMNIMLVSVTERTREIGIRLAIGARGREVLVQFLVEAVVLSMLGGVVGIGVGFGGALVASRMLAIPFTVPPYIVGLAFGFSFLVGVAFGFFPARKAARMRPIDALRYE
jgi:putative ABC transport system permease protein